MRAEPEPEAPVAATREAAAPLGTAAGSWPSSASAGNRAVVSALRIDRKVELRDVGRGEQSGFARAGELVDRMTTVSPSLIFSQEGRELRYEQVEGLTPNSFDTQMMALIDRDEVLPMRLTNRHGLLGDKTNGFHDAVDGDAFTSGYVDIDDLLAGDDLGFQMLLVHFLTERAATRNYARRIGTDFSQAEFDRGHSLGIEAEAQILRDFFGDPSIRIVADSPSVTIRRVFRNSRGDRIRRRIRLGRGDETGINASSVDVVTAGNVTMTAERLPRPARQRARRRCARRASRVRAMADEEAEFEILSEEGETPDEHDLQILETLEEHGEDLSEPREIRIDLLFPDEESSNAAEEELTELGYEVASFEGAGEEEQWTLRATRELRVDHENITGFRHRFDELAARHGGEFDGWEASAD